LILIAHHCKQHLQTRNNEPEVENGVFCASKL